MQTNDAHTTQPPLSLQDIAHFIQIVREFGAGGGITIRKANPAIPFVRDDGGRTQAGIKLGKRAHDCVGRAIAIASQVPYRTVYHDLLSFCKRLGKRSKYAADSHPRSGVYRIVYDRYLRHNGWLWVPCMRIGSGCKVHLRSDELPNGRLIVSVSGHLTAVIDGVVHDLVDPSRDGTRCVYRYYHHPRFGGEHHAEG